MRIWLAPAASLIIACEGADEKPAPVPAPPPAVTVAAAPSTGPAKPACEHTGRWAKCSIERRLKQAGLVLKELDDEPKRAGFSIEPIVYTVGSAARLEIFIYTDAKAAEKDMATIDTLTATPPGSPSQWESAPTLIRSANLAAVLLSQNPRQAERVMLAITAGPPQPGSPR